LLYQDTDPLHKIQQSIDQQLASINSLKATFGERLDHLEDELSAILQYMEESHEAQSIRKHIAPSSSLDSLNV